MHFEITKEVLLHSLLQIYKILPPKTLFPIFHYIKIKALDNVCYLEAMDYNKNIQLQIKDTDLVVKQNGSLVIIGKHLVDIIKKIDSCSLEMTLVEDYLLFINSKNSEYKLKVIDLQLFPPVSFDFQSDKFFAIKNEILKKIIKEVNVAASRDKQQKTLMGVNFIYENSLLRVLATDTFRIAQKEISLDLNYFDFNITVSYKNLEELYKLLEYQKDELVHISINQQKMILRCDNLLFQTTLLEGKYPAWPIIKVSSFPFFVKMNRLDCLKTLERVSLVLTKEENIFSNIIRLYIRLDNIIEISANSDEIGQASEQLNAIEVFANENVETFLNVQHLEDILKVFTVKEFKIIFDSFATSFVICSEEDNSMLYLVFPVVGQS
ncbi:MAG: DNA polymerase III subunit beta [Sweet potato little leaf phytoplasma]|uniref:DNA polymerase III subunit beta n=2 Tax=16SrII (Peanut WB group) TaxID=85621 RepID=A0A9K3WRF0_9MOLU|nr:MULTISPECIES: DNA polymerase III subunit beta [Phytoplasma]MCG3566722.1 DNA polymerase III subunit beta [Sesame phyllody phytoplasma]MDO7987043.1 DNA polymerase III subunit beta [Sweet potato little leaf phytoplasma]MDO8005264.1 DNA polymerase III subunit beta [Sweet potato little leaf phytoplasma]MDO8008623.1 DNA polymerase III subunit beta [Sweet potato little leaf phytoplasma]MDO8020236.1 DNA polymerase III subunit beta [Sweet potato little leaf phytoplasma]